MTINEYLDLYKTGIEVGIISVDELEDFIYNEIERLDNVPYCYIDVLDAVSKGVNEVTKRIGDYFFECGYTQQTDNECLIERILVGRIAAEYKNGKADMKTTAYKLNKLSLFYDPICQMGNIYYIFESAEHGSYYTMENVQDELDEIFEMAVYEYL
ncbi:MAG: hypothetical protein HDT24_10335 [Ruminococcus sp.]|nr:hypothetical protein [Ruminococcus sp.]